MEIVESSVQFFNMDNSQSSWAFNIVFDETYDGDPVIAFREMLGNETASMISRWKFERGSRMMSNKPSRTRGRLFVYDKSIAAHIRLLAVKKDIP